MNALLQRMRQAGAGVNGWRIASAVMLVVVATLLLGGTTLLLLDRPWPQRVAWFASWAILAEGLNKLERSDPFAGAVGWKPRLLGLLWLFVPWAWRRDRVVVVLKIFGWALLAVGAAGYIARLYINAPWFSPDVAVIAGFAILIVRSRVKEG
jgi:hypothetical protein